MVIQHNAGLGKSYAKVGQLAEAKAAFDIYHAKFPDSAKDYENWTLYYALLGDEPQAIFNLQEALKLGFKGLIWLKTDRSFKKLRQNKAFKRIVKELEAQLKAESQDVSLLHP
jgi:tetratricopeptide (TPR) repeat protein